MIYSLYDRVIAITPAVKNILDKWLGAYSQRVVVISNGVKLSGENIEEEGQSNALSDTHTSLLMVARLDAPKRQDIVIKALSKLGPGFKLFLAGTGKQG
ncbi:hypothetical protein [Chitinophaga sedimenti]|uniref:hypothetical protein n=1 Tax=Chitinophaga sedimenti TaxID=2033606 RepID=UPI00249E8E68|nr:hypothetical protein [Chitinophaga sedimenti]